MKRILSLLIIIASTTAIFAKPVSIQTAKNVGSRFINFKTNSTLKGNMSLDLVYTSSSVEVIGWENPEKLNYFYIFNINKDKGYVIVSADNVVLPILGYSDESGFNPKGIPAQVSKWLEGYTAQIRYAIVNGLEANAKAKLKWSELLSDYSALAGPPMNKTGVGALTKNITWDQEPYYNDKCPYDNTYSQRTVTGCVATAMAQVMKFWGYPAKGSGFHSYSHSTYGTLSADFANTKYNWSAMPNKVTSTDTNVSKLMYQIGVSVDMNYNVASKGGSGAYVISSASAGTNCAEYALKTYFGYDKALSGVERSKYTDAQWIKLMETESDSGRPVIYAGFGKGGGHCFVMDGYDQNDYLHFNWGWSGYYNGNFEIDSLNPGGTGTGGGSGGYNSNQQAIIGIKGNASKTTPTFTMGLDGDVVLNYSVNYYGNKIVVNTDIKNNGSNNFSGDLCAGVFDQNSAFVDYVQILTSKSISSGGTYAATFTDTSTYGFLPGNYTVYAYYRSSGGSWQRLNAISTSVTDYADLTVKNPDTLEMYAKDSLIPSVFVKGKPASVHLNVWNTNQSGSFIGDLDLSLYNLDGTWAANIDQKLGLNLPKNSYYVKGLTFTTANVTVKPGTYLLALTRLDTMTSNWWLVGSTYYQNPIKVNVQAPALSPDKYEVNDTTSTAYNLSLSFSSNSASVKTTGSNFHTGSDQDYYKAVLPTGFDYTITARLQDMYSSNDGNTYTVDAGFSYSIDNGANWFGSYDDVMPSAIKVKKGGTIIFHCTPNFTGSTGTYELDLALTRTVTSGIENAVANNKIEIYPNPAHSMINIDLSQLSENPEQISLINMQGQQIMNITSGLGQKNIPISVSNLAQGIYIVKIQTQKENITKEIMIK